MTALPEMLRHDLVAPMRPAAQQVTEAVERKVADRFARVPGRRPERLPGRSRHPLDALCLALEGKKQSQRPQHTVGLTQSGEHGRGTSPGHGSPCSPVLSDNLLEINCVSSGAPRQLHARFPPAG